MEGYIKKIGDMKDAEEKVGVVDPREIKRGSRKYYRYMGSLTTPPCTEGVIWTLVKKVRTVSKEQVHLLREAVHDVSTLVFTCLTFLHTYKIYTIVGVK